MATNLYTSPGHGTSASVTFTQTNPPHSIQAGTVTQIVASATQAGVQVAFWTKLPGSDGSVQQANGTWLHSFTPGIGSITLTPGDANPALRPAFYGIVDISDIVAVSA